MSPQNTPRHRKSQVSIDLKIKKNITISFRLKDYLLEYVSHIDSLLKASLSHETLANGNGNCMHCDNGAIAVWRCRDCSMGLPMCRGCMRKTHKENPFHQIKQWNGHFFWLAELWEVGTYLLICHHTRVLSCNIIKVQEDLLENLES